MTKKIISILLSFIFILSLNTVSANVLNDGGVFLKQASGSVNCTVVGSAMMLRRRAVLDGAANWQTDITEAKMMADGSVWNLSVGGMMSDYTFAGMRVQRLYFEGLSGKKDEASVKADAAKKKEQIIAYLFIHPEGMLVYDADRPHAVLITDYHYPTDTFYCADPASGTAKGRIKWEGAYPSLANNPGQTQQKKLEEIDRYWGITNKQGWPPEWVPSKPVLSLIAGNESNSSQFSWNDCDYADEYTITIKHVESNMVAFTARTQDTFFVKHLPVGEYEAQITASNSGNKNKTTGDAVKFSVIPNEFIPFASAESGDYIYRLYDNRVSAEDLIGICEKLGGEPADIRSDAEQDFIAGLAANGNMDAYFISIKKINNIWQYGDGTPVLYTKWAENQPDNRLSRENYAAVYKADGYKWHDIFNFPKDFTCGFVIKVYNDIGQIKNIKLNRNKINLLPGGEYQMSVTINPPNTTADTTQLWESADGNIASVDETGLITAHNFGETEITVTISEHTAAVKVLVTEYLLGDINLDGKINGMDLLYLKQHILGIENKTLQEDTPAFYAADMNQDGKINGMDLMLLKKEILF